MTTLYFVRHGESYANLNNLFTGQSNASLTRRGRAQAANTDRLLRDVQFDAIYSSDLARARETGDTIAATHKLTLQTDERLREIFGGDWEDIPFKSITKFPEYDLWYHKIGLSRCPNGESVAEVQARVRAAVEDIVRANPGKTVCISTHATPIRVMEGVWTDTPLEELHNIPWVTNASVTVVEYDDDMHGHIVERDVHHHLSGIVTNLPEGV